MQTTIPTNPALVSQSDHRFLRRMLAADSVVCAASGIFLVALAQPVSTFLGIGEPGLILVIGLVLLASAVLIFRIVREVPLHQASVGLVVSANAIWVIASIVFLILDLPILTSGGKLAILVQAFVTADVAFFEWLGWRWGR